MYTNPKETRIRPTCRLIIQFQEKGYKCEEIVDQDSTILYLTHEKRSGTQDCDLNRLSHLCGEPHNAIRTN
jgi:hypothetical protein